MLGFSHFVSSSVPALMRASPGITSTSVMIGEPHSEQNRRCTGFPLSPVSSKVLMGPVMERAAAGTATTTEENVPTCFWQFLQWHTAVKTGSPSAVYLTLPQRHPPLMRICSSHTSLLGRDVTLNRNKIPMLQCLWGTCIAKSA